jgi:hypothetical protein
MGTILVQESSARVSLPIDKKDMTCLFHKAGLSGTRTKYI